MLSTTFTHPRLKAFAQRFGKAHIDLASHGAFPLALTPELLYCLRENFLPDVPWIAVSDILLFLCDPVGYQLYELDGEIRHELLLYLTEHFGQGRLCGTGEKGKYNLADFTIAYIRSSLHTNYRADLDLGAAPQWTALAYTKPEQAVQDIAQILERVLQKTHPGEWVKFTSLIESYANTEPLIKAGFAPLLVLSRGWDAKARQDEETAAEEFNQLGKPGTEITVAGVKFHLPGLGDGLPTFEFEYVTVNRRGEVIKRETGKARYFITQIPDKDGQPPIPLEMVYIPGGKFMMGSPEVDNDEYPQHQVTVPEFFISKYPITQVQWRGVASLPEVKRKLKANPSRFKGDNLPVEKVSWDDAVEFCARLSRETGRKYRLPSEAEWEYACRAGTQTPFHFGETITDKLANYDATYTFADEPKGDYRAKTTIVGSFPPNAFGLYDIHGNVWEWCEDLWHDNYNQAPVDGSSWLDKLDKNENDNRFRLLRGGSWYFSPDFCRAGNRRRFDPDFDDSNIGFRVVCGVAPRTS
ncbi:MAG TPA: formylglycine-generating enzyme family protein [Cyanobacteria bacterium UBA11149]|nr:formylglycine-generating enzyme family protein [Cyanobacteria bacterium UBA11367]HBE56302.1 formylglycine-generating enzyme family protein [Cyanobacteria bacterium UBA11366]HBK65540.1 formylglycine-generating enzyme family protein [Cyanobacteria bacterium UBA11166]HBR74997.1 formylglycine-generating enzyme family protein [Cyanobacteria bacterium UBA11159]HBS70821.1 formylglycine-generating enzyme family protein [Cyanobacteria bacterium UBA11153]HBW90715.1 formylglycine-generating enzyme fam